MRSAPALMIAVLTACGGMTAPEPELVVVAHQDDDLLFMQPDLFDVVSQHRPIVVVYVTAGDGSYGIEFARSRQVAAKYAYGTVAGSQQWACDWTDIASHTAWRCRLADQPVTLLFLGYPDGGPGGSFSGSLLNLWQGTIASATTIADVPTTYDREGVINTMAAIVEQTRPRLIRTLELSATHGYDHSDHMMVGTLTQLALARTTSAADLIAYRGYNVNAEPANLTEEEFARSSIFMRAYGACVLGCGACGVTPCEKIEDPWYDGFMHREYSVAMRSVPLAGTLTSPAGCVGFDSTGDPDLAACATAPDIALEADGLVRVGEQCLGAMPDGTLELGSCDPDPLRYFQLDEEGHLWSGMAPAPTAGMLLDHATCLYVADGDVKIGLCGASREFRWTLSP